MVTVRSAVEAGDRLAELVDRLAGQADFVEVVASLAAGHAATLDGVWGSSCALAAAALAARAPATLLVVAPHADQADEFIDDLAVFSPVAPRYFPALSAPECRSTDPAEPLTCDEAFGDRLSVIKSLRGPDPPRMVVAPVQALVQSVPAPDAVDRHTRWLRVGAEMSLQATTRWLAENGFHATPAVELPGEFSLRGGILDVFARDAEHPVRVEWFGDEIVSIRRFEVASQRSLGLLDAIELTALGSASAQRACLTDYLPAGSWVFLIEPGELEHQGRSWVERSAGPGAAFTVDEVLQRAYRFSSVTAWAVAPGSLETTCRLRIESVERFGGDVARVRRELDESCAAEQVYLVCQTEAEARRLGELLADSRVAAEDRLRLVVGTLHHGFRLVTDRVVVLSAAEIFRKTELPRPARRRLGRAIESFLELRPRDLVVHVAHGIARYQGLELLEKDGQAEEHLILEFQGGTRLYVPSSKIGLVQKYVGGAKARPKLAKLGGRLWERQKRRVGQAVGDLAAELLEMQAIRAAQPGIAFPPDTPWQREFDASFPYQETPDQLATIEAIKQDMTRSRPMDRLLCGDVGYGKTEVAMRAAFKAVEAGYQVAVLVPTTILAEQHHRTFRARMAEFPFEIAVLSRFATRGQQAEIIRRLADGRIDIVIGTHRLVQSDVRFHNLGLVIIDEEQRFGVEVKERLKTLRRTVDVLTMTATPIPRTLHLGLVALRDISNLETPPEDRLAVETRVCRFEDELVRHAVLRELGRGGQIFFVHNRIEDIAEVARRLGRIVPEASLAVAHGRMPEHELERVMVDFVDHRFDLLLATTIVESGLDIPNANTIFIDEADRYGLADLHQLRGRVGRYKHRAYCYLLVDPNKALSPNAARRLRAIEEFSDMGAGFAIAMRDLEIRGAGNILGTEQSGHIAAVGYELYCSLLEQAVRRARNLPPRATIDVDVDLPVAAYLPPGYVPDMRQKIDLYRRLARVTANEELDDFRAELIDRFGPPPPEVEGLLAIAELRLLAFAWQIRAIHLEDGFAVFGYTSPPSIHQLARRSGGRLRVVDQRSAYLPLTAQDRQTDRLLVRLKSLLQPG